MQQMPSLARAKIPTSTLKTSDSTSPSTTSRKDSHDVNVNVHVYGFGGWVGTWSNIAVIAVAALFGIVCGIYLHSYVMKSMALDFWSPFCFLVGFFGDSEKSTEETTEDDETSPTMAETAGTETGDFWGAVKSTSSLATALLVELACVYNSIYTI